MDLPEKTTESVEAGQGSARIGGNSSPGIRFLAWAGNNKLLLLMIVPAIAIALIPLYGILFPPLVDFPDHIFVAKLLWEKLSGTTHLDIEISTFLGYRLLSYLILAVISFCSLMGISFVHLPQMATMLLMSLHGAIVSTVIYFPLKVRSVGSTALAVCFALPAAVCMYSACWFMGFAGYTLAITLLVPAIFLTDRFLRTGKFSDGFLLFLSIFLVYTAHPFATTFWLMWCFGRLIASIVTGDFLREWLRLLLLGVIYLPIFLYHFWATSGTNLEPTSTSLFSQSPFVSFHDWYLRLYGFWDAAPLRADDATDSRAFAHLAIGMVLFSTILAFVSKRQPTIKKLALASILLVFVSSWVNEKFIPITTGFWLAYDYRFFSTVYVVCLAVSGVIIVQCLPVASDKLRYKLAFILLAVVSVYASFDHLVEVRTAYKRFDAQARQYMTQVLNDQQPTGIYMPHSAWHPDGTFLNNYVCLNRPDCIPQSTCFRTYGGDLYPVKVRSFTPRPATGPLVAYWKLDEVNSSDASPDSSGSGYTATPRGATVVEGRIGRARAFNGTTDYIDVSPIDLPGPISVAAWVYSDNFGQNGYIILKNPVNVMWSLLLHDGTLRWRGGSTMEIACPAPSNSAWHHIVATQDGTDAKIYIDGERCVQGQVDAIGNSPPSSISIGRYDTINYDYFNGRIDEVRLYNRALSAAEVAALMPADLQF